MADNIILGGENLLFFRSKVKERIDCIKRSYEPSIQKAIETHEPDMRHRPLFGLVSSFLAKDEPITIEKMDSYLNKLDYRYGLSGERTSKEILDRIENLVYTWEHYLCYIEDINKAEFVIDIELYNRVVSTDYETKIFYFH